MVKVSGDEELSEGFLPIHKMVYDSVNKHIRDFKKKLESQGIDVIGVHGDALFVSPEDALKLDYPEKYECSYHTMGLIKKEMDKSIVGWKVMEPPRNSDTIVSGRRDVKTAVSTMKDEWSAEEAREILSQVPPTDEDVIVKPFNWLLTADLPGSGKSHTAIKYAQAMSNNYVVACYSNEQALEWKRQGVEAHAPSTRCAVQDRARRTRRTRRLHTIML
jgi:hypothetical protein